MRRELRFKTLDDARAELARFEKSPVETFGNWSYFQILSHCSWALEGSIKGLKREMPWLKRYVSGPLGARSIILRGYIPVGVQGPKTERIEGDDKAALAALRKAMDDFEKHEGPFSDHPRFGPLNKKKWTLFHAFHLANHLGWTKPKP